MKYLNILLIVFFFPIAAFAVAPVTGALTVCESSTTALTDATTVAWDCSAAQVATLTLTAARTMGAPTNGVNGTSYRLVLTSAGFTPSWNAVFKFPSGTVPSGLTGTCVFDFHYDGTNFLCVGQNAAEA